MHATFVSDSKSAVMKQSVPLHFLVPELQKSLQQQSAPLLNDFQPLLVLSVSTQERLQHP